MIATESDAGLELAGNFKSEANYATAAGNWPRGIRRKRELRTVCLQCGSIATGTSFLTCSNLQCRTTWRVNHCLICKQPVDSCDPATPRCDKCGWLICASCLACNCPS
jgi:hypothetical protein